MRDSEEVHVVVARAQLSSVETTSENGLFRAKNTVVFGSTNDGNLPKRSGSV